MRARLPARAYTGNLLVSRHGSRGIGESARNKGCHPERSEGSAFASEGSRLRSLQGNGKKTQPNIIRSPVAKVIAEHRFQ